MCAGDASDEEHDGGGVEESFGRGEGRLEILAESSVATDPGEEALDHPTARMDGEADLLWVLSDDLDGDARGHGDALAGIGAVGEGVLDEGKAAPRCLQQGHGAVAVLNRGRVRLEYERPTVGVDHRMPLAALDLLAGVVTARAAGLGALHALAVDHRRRRACLAPGPLAVAHQQVMIDGREQAAVAQADEPAIDGAHRGEAVRQHAPRTTRA